ncbi:MAG: hypothetical protein ACRDTM_08320, partial [Micromonosporaceae bacterium]
WRAALAGFRQLALDEAAPVSLRVAAAWRWAATELGTGAEPDWTQALRPFKVAVGLLPRTAPRHVGHADRARVLAGFAGLASDAAGCAILSLFCRGAHCSGPGCVTAWLRSARRRETSVARSLASGGGPGGLGSRIHRWSTSRVGSPLISGNA